MSFFMGNPNRDDAIDEEKLVLCCACCCANVSFMPTCDCFGCSGKAGVCCCNIQCCCKAGAPLLVPFGMVGIRPECDGMSCLNAQCHACCVVLSAAIPCNKEVPLAVSVLGLTMFPKCGFLLKQKEIMNRD